MLSVLECRRVVGDRCRPVDSTIPRHHRDGSHRVRPLGTLSGTSQEVDSAEHLTCGDESLASGQMIRLVIEPSAEHPVSTSTQTDRRILRRSCDESVFGSRSRQRPRKRDSAFTSPFPSLRPRPRAGGFSYPRSDRRPRLGMHKIACTRSRGTASRIAPLHRCRSALLLAALRYFRAASLLLPCCFSWPGLPVSVRTWHPGGG